MINRRKRLHKPSTRARDVAANLAALPSLGSASAQMLIEVGISDEATLKRLGPQASFRALRFRFGRRVSTNFIYALECAIRGIAWRALEPRRRTLFSILRAPLRARRRKPRPLNRGPARRAERAGGRAAPPRRRVRRRAAPAGARGRRAASGSPLRSVA